jgi:hypothetical protein
MAGRFPQISPHLCGLHLLPFCLHPYTQRNLRPLAPLLHPEATKAHVTIMTALIVGLFGAGKPFLSLLAPTLQLLYTMLLRFLSLKFAYLDTNVKV